MYRSRLFVGVALLSGVLLGSGLARGVAAQDQTNPLVALSGLQTSDGVRYSVALTNMAGVDAQNLDVAVQLPTDAVFVDASETPGYTRFEGETDGILAWTAPVFSGSDLVDSFSFVLAQTPAGDFGVHLDWQGDQAGSLDMREQPTVAVATAGDGDAVIGGADQAGAFVPVGDTGVLVADPAGQIPAGTQIHVHKAGADANPPAEIGDFWWCSEVEIDGLPAGSSVLVLVPTRRTLPPRASIALFQQVDAGWNQLDAHGTVTADGQYVAYLHRGGLVAIGTQPFNLPVSVQQRILIQGPAPANGGARLADAVTQAQFSTLLLKLVSSGPCENSGCAGLKGCSVTVLAATISPGTHCVNAGENGPAGVGTRSGQTFCSGPSGTNCTGFVFQDAFGNPATGGLQGTICSFPDVHNPRQGASCNLF